MALQIEWTPHAKSQLNQILVYWINGNGSDLYSLKLYQSIKIILKILVKYPESGRLTENLLEDLKL